MSVQEVNLYLGLVGVFFAVIAIGGIVHATRELWKMRKK